MYMTNSYTFFWLGIGLCLGFVAQLGTAHAQPEDASGARHPAAEDLHVRWEVLTNDVDEGNRFRSEIELTNRGDVPLRGEGWTLYFNFLRPIDPSSVPPSAEITRINGDFFKLEPGATFAPVEPGETRAIPFEAAWSAIKAIDAPDGYYVVFDGDSPAPIGEATVAPFTRPQQTSRGPNDVLPVPTPERRYAENQRVNGPVEDVGPITPTPVSLTRDSGRVTLSGAWTIDYEQGLRNEAQTLAALLEPYFGARLSMREGTPSSGATTIALRQDTVTIDGEPHAEEAYQLRVAPERGIKIVGSDAAGVFYGVQSLRDLLPADPATAGGSVTLDAMTVADAPRFGYRGLHLDVSRNFQPVATVKRLLDAMAAYKLNTFHFHLTDDEGWRLAIDGLPELTQVGGRRGHTLTERDHLVPSYGSGPDPAPEASQGSGWYSRDDYVEILRYATARHIRVVPEIDLPGHARAAIQAMESRYHRLMDEGRTEAAERYRLVHPQDTSQYRSIQGWTDNVIDVCQPATYRFLTTVFDDIEAMYAEADAPLSTLHVGGDEVPSGAWTGSPACDELIASSDAVDGVDGLYDYFFERVRGMLDERGWTMAGWGEVALDEGEGGHADAHPDPDLAGTGVQAYVWNNLWGTGTEDIAYKLANAGTDVVMSHASNFYFDMAYNKHPQESGYYWADFVDTRDPFIFEPLTLFRSAEKTAMGHAINPSFFDDHTRLQAEARDRILGLQGQLWGETLRSPDRVDYMAAPRLLGLAERAWAPRPAWTDVDDRVDREEARADAWTRFAHRLGQHELARLAHQFDLQYRLPTPGAVIEDGMLRANVPYPGLTIRYTTDGRTPTSASPRYTAPVALDGEEPVHVRAFDATGRGGRTAVVER